MHMSLSFCPKIASLVSLPQHIMANPFSSPVLSLYSSKSFASDIPTCSCWFRDLSQTSLGMVPKYWLHPAHSADVTGKLKWTVTGKTLWTHSWLSQFFRISPSWWENQAKSQSSWTHPHFFQGKLFHLLSGSLRYSKRESASVVHAKTDSAVHAKTTSVVHADDDDDDYDYDDDGDALLCDVLLLLFQSFVTRKIASQIPNFLW